MKKATVLTLFFFFFSVVQPPQAKAVVLIDDALIGSVLLAGIAVAGVHGMATYYEKTGENPVQALVDGVDHVFQPAILAFQENFVTPESFPAAAAQYVGVEAAVGAKIADIYNFVKDTAAGSYNALKDIFSDHSSDETYSPLNPGDVLPMDDGTFWRVAPPGEWKIFTTNAFPSSYPSTSGTTFHFSDGTEGFHYWFSLLKFGPLDSNGRCTVYNLPLEQVTTPPTVFPSPGSLDEGPAAAAIAASADPQVKEEVNDVLRSLPPAQVVTTGQVSPAAELDDAPPPVVTSNDLQKFYGQNAVDVANKATEVAADPNATPADVAAAQTAAQAASQQAENAATQAEPEPETYTDVPLSGFADPYNPGPFDIPDRFDTFLANVAGTGLFSLPSQYFNSLPGGGSPVYTVEAGSYGTHTIDLSETMGTGLAVLKTVLLLCFAFLSVRVVVLKR